MISFTVYAQKAMFNQLCLQTVTLTLKQTVNFYVNVLAKLNIAILQKLTEL